MADNAANPEQAAGDRARALPASPAEQFVLLAGVKSRSAVNAVDRAIALSPLRAFLIALAVVFSWISMYLFFRAVFREIYASALENLIVQQFILDFFFIILFLLLTLSNAVISHGALFGKGETQFLAAGPLHPVVIVGMKYLESLALSSWSLLLLGLPMMIAYGEVYDQPWPFYPLFILYFLAFITVPAAVGIAAAFVVANFLRPALKRWLLAGAAVVLAVVMIWTILVWGRLILGSQQFLTALYDLLLPLRNIFLPSAWMSSGLVASANNRMEDAWRYWFILLANGLFVSWLGILWISNSLYRVLDRAQSAGGRRKRRTDRFVGPAAEAVVFYLPPQLRAIVLKDLRSFLRYPSQWSQMLIFIGLLFFYTLNIRHFPFDLTKPAAQQLLGFLNLTSISLIAATFTSRFVFPLPSLESGQMWLLGAAPISRRAILWCKWLLATGIVTLVALPLIILSAHIVALPTIWMLVQIGYVLLLCGGLTAMAMGLGARYPVLNQRNMARIASGLGGTLNLVLTIFFVVGMLLSYALAATSPFRHPNARAGPLVIGLVGGLIFSLGTIWGVMNYGIRSYEKKEF